MNDSTPSRISGLSRLTIDGAQRPASSQRGWLWLLLIVALMAMLGGGGIWWYYRTTGADIIAALGEQPIEVRVFTVSGGAKRSMPVVLVANGKIVSDRRVNVATKVSGQIVELNVEQGDHVKEGDVLARVEDVIYRAQRDEASAELERTEFAVIRARVEHTRALAAIGQAEAELAFEQYNYERLQGLRGTQDASDFEFINAKNRFDASAAALDVARADAAARESAIALAQADVAAARATLRLAQKRLDDCAILAPISGVILERNAQIGDFLAAEGGRGANANAQLVAIADMVLLRVEIDVSERDVHRVFAGQRARITPDSHRERSYDGHVMWVDPIGDYARATVQAKVRILDPGPDLRVEGSAKVEFLGRTTGEEPNAASTLWLPKSVVKLTPGSDDAEVFTVTGDRAVSNQVRLGARTEDAVEIRAGVVPGMQLVADHLDEVKQGSLLKVLRAVTESDMK